MFLQLENGRTLIRLIGTHTFKYPHNINFLPDICHARPSLREIIQIRTIPFAGKTFPMQRHAKFTKGILKKTHVVRIKTLALLQHFQQSDIVRPTRQIRTLPRKRQSTKLGNKLDIDQAAFALLDVIPRRRF